MATWLWLKGIPGPPANDEWFEVLAYQQPLTARTPAYGGSGVRGQSAASPKDFSVTVPNDSRSNQFFQALVNGQVMELASLLFEPQTQYVFSKCTFTNVSTGGGKDGPISCTLMYESFTIDYGTE